MITCNRCQTKLSDLESAKGQCPHCHAPLEVTTIDLLLPWKQMSIGKNECATDQTVELDTRTVAPTTSVSACCRAHLCQYNRPQFARSAKQFDCRHIGCGIKSGE